jgi:hypothetical protein
MAKYPTTISGGSAVYPRLAKSCILVLRETRPGVERNAW